MSKVGCLPMADPELVKGLVVCCWLLVVSYFACVVSARGGVARARLGG